MYRAGQSFRIDASGATDTLSKARFAESQAEQGAARDVAARVDRVAPDYRRWWAENQPEVRWAETEAHGAYVVDVSHGYWRETCFLLTFEFTQDATRFALLFLGQDQAACEALVRSEA